MDTRECVALIVDFHVGRRREDAVLPLCRKERSELRDAEDGSNAWACHRVPPPFVCGCDSVYGLLRRRTMAADISIMLHLELFIMLLLLLLLLLLLCSHCRWRILFGRISFISEC